MAWEALPSIEVSLEETSNPAETQALQRVRSERLELQGEREGVESPPSLRSQSCLVRMPAQVVGLTTKREGSPKQVEAREGGREREESLDWKSETQETAVERSERWKREVSLRWRARPMPKRLRRVWQQILVWFWFFFVVEVVSVAMELQGE